MRVYRIAKAIYSTSGAEMMSGEGGLRAGARWHTKGRPIIYTATSQALATLEIAVNLKNPGVIPAYCILEVDVPDGLIISLDAGTLPAGWNTRTGEPIIARSIGDRWLVSQASAALQVPSSVIPDEDNVLINPEHPDFRKVTFGDPLTFPFDSRLLSDAGIGDYRAGDVPLGAGAIKFTQEYVLPSRESELAVDQWDDFRGPDQSGLQVCVPVTVLCIVQPDTPGGQVL